jgi:hypothetical protein
VANLSYQQQAETAKLKLAQNEGTPRSGEDCSRVKQRTPGAMYSNLLRYVFLTLACASCVSAQQRNSCASLANLKAERVEITKAVAIPAGTTEPNPWGPGHSAPLPAYCRIEGVINHRTGLGGEVFGITFVLAMPDKWNGDFLMQGGAGSNGVVAPPLGLNAAGQTP